MTFLELCQTVRQEVGISGTGPSTVVNQEGQLKVIVDFVAEADFQIQSIWHDWNFLWSQYSSTLSVGVRAPAVQKPTDFANWDTRSFFLNYTSDNSTHLDPLDYTQWRSELRQRTAINATPNFVVVQPDDNLIVDPPPDATYTITADYWRVPTRMTANTDLSPIPVQYHRIIVARAKTMWGEREEAPEILVASSAEYADLLDKLESQSLPGQGSRRFSSADTQTIVRTE